MTDLTPKAPDYYQTDNVHKYAGTAYNESKNFIEAALKLDWHDVLIVIKIIALVFSVFLFFILIYIKWKKSEPARNKPVVVAETAGGADLPAPTVTKFDNKWHEIKNKVLGYNAGDWKLAVIEADQFLDDILKNSGFPGETMGERLMLIKPDQLLSLQYVWDAHKLRNLVVHDSKFELTHNQALAAVESFEQALKELEALS